MSLHYILDGYNIIKQSDFLSHKLLKDARRDLIRFITDKKPCGSVNNKVTIVFDGADCNFPFSRNDNKRVEVLFTQPLRPGAGFTHNHSADERIKKMVGDSKNPKSIVVVSDDREIQFFIKSCGARSMGVAEFLRKGMPSPKHAKELPKTELTSSQVAKINRELAKTWLK